jgi:predicted nuclease of predicted toxin-antitoxin system
VTHLKSQGFDITAIGVDHSGISDEQVMKIAIADNRTIVTYDSDYGELIFKHGYKPEAGVIFIRFQPIGPLETSRILHRLIETPGLSFKRTLTVVNSNSLRQKRY